MGKKYFCEYCDKSFADNQVNRKNHMKGARHRQNRRMHYDSVTGSGTSSAAAILAEELAKKPCIKFQNYGHCDFGAGCWYSHLTAERRQFLESQVAKSEAAERRKQQKLDQSAPNLADWLAKRNKNTESNHVTSRKELPARVQMKPTPREYSLPAHLAVISNLPPSLLPPPPDIYENLPNAEWG